MFKSHLIRALVLAVVAVGFLVVSGKSGAAPRRTLSVGFYCLSLGHQRLECVANVSGGSGSYTYQWTPTPIVGNQDAIIRCTRAYSYQTVSLTVTDNATSATAGDSGSFYCGDAQ